MEQVFASCLIASVIVFMQLEQSNVLKGIWGLKQEVKDTTDVIVVPPVGVFFVFVLRFLITS